MQRSVTPGPTHAVYVVALTKHQEGKDSGVMASMLMSGCIAPGRSIPS
jgi:hypothetical protein